MPREDIHDYRRWTKDRLHDAMESSIFICGITPLDFGESIYDIFCCDPSLDCNTHIEGDFYTSRIKAERIELRCHCVGEFNSRVELNSNLKYPECPYSVVLPVYKVCLQNGCNIIVLATRRNALAKQARVDVEAVKEAGRQEYDLVVADATPVTTPAAIPDANAAPRPNSTKRTLTRRVCVYICLLLHLFLMML